MISKAYRTLLFGAMLMLASWVQSQSCTVNVVDISGNTKTKPFIFTNELTFDLETPYVCEAMTSKLLPAYKNQLVNLNLFNHVDVKLSNDTLYVEVIEKLYFWPIPFLETADRNFNQWIRFKFDPQRTNYGLYLFLYNRRGRNETLKLTAGNGYTRSLGVQYIVPQLEHQPKIGFEFESKYLRNKEIWFKTQEDQLQFFSDYENNLITNVQNKAIGRYRLSPFQWVSLGAKVHYTIVDPLVVRDSVNPGFLAHQRPQQWLNLVTAGFKQVFVDNRLQPFEGHTFHIDADAGILNGDFTASISGSAATYNKVSERWYSAFYGKGKIQKRSNSYALNKGFGYGDNVRGFENYVVEGESLALFKSELRWVLLKDKVFPIKRMPVKGYRKLPVTMAFVVFNDFGKVWSKDVVNDNVLPNTWLQGYGAGFLANFYFDKTVRIEWSNNSIGGSGLFFHFEKGF